MSTAIAKPMRAPASNGLRLILKLVAALFAAAFIAGGALTLLNLLSHHSFTVRSSYSGVRSLTIDSGGGDVRLTSAPAGAQLTAVARVSEDLETPRRGTALNGSGLLRLSGHCSVLMSIYCSVDYTVAVPAGVSVNAASGAGDITASGLTTTKPLSLQSGAGDVDAFGISAPVVHLNAAAGDITARLTTPPRYLDASSGVGDIILTVPNVPYDVTASAGAGEVSDQGLRIDPSSPRRLEVTAGAGSITIGTSSSQPPGRPATPKSPPPPGL
jgi:hypothetical protein